MAQLHAGDCFGEASLILQAPSPVSVKAASHWADLFGRGRTCPTGSSDFAEAMSGCL